MSKGLREKKAGGKAQQTGHKQKKKRKNDSAPQEKQKPPEAVQEEDIQLEEDDYALLAEFGDRIDFLTGATPLQHESSATPRKRKREDEAVNAKKVKDATADKQIAQEEENYEKQSRKIKKPVPDVVDLLPFKTADGSLVYDKSRSSEAALAITMQVDGVRIDDDALLEEDEEDAEDAATPEHHKNGKHSPEATQGAVQTKYKQGRLDSWNDALKSARMHHNKTMQRTYLQQQMASHASKLLEDPESNLSSLRALLELTLDDDTVVRRLALLSLSSIFKDVLPGYRIRELTEEERAVKVTKAVQKLRDYENALLRGFQSYVKVLCSMLPPSKHSVNNQRVAVKCLAELLTGVPHFNCMHEVLEALIHSACGLDAQCRSYACSALASLLCRTQHTDVMVDAVQLAVDAVRKSKCVCPPDIAHALLAVKFKDLSRSDVEKGSQTLKRKFKHKTRRRREDAIAAALQEAAIAADKDQVRIHQIQILEALFEMFFRVLKKCTASGLVRGPDSGSGSQGGSAGGAKAAAAGAAIEMSPETVEKKWPLLSVTLQGLAKYTHLIGLEYFNDLMEVLQQLQGSPALPMVLRMQCLLTTVDILHAQDDALNVDRGRMYGHLYNALSSCALQPLRDDDSDSEQELEPNAHNTGVGAVQKGVRQGTGSPAQGRRKNTQNMNEHVLDGGGSKMKDRHSKCSSLVAKATVQLLTALKPGDVARLGAFVKRLCACALHAEPGLCMALLVVTTRLLQRHNKLHGLLEGDAVGSYGQGGYDPFQQDPSAARALSSSLWELSALLQHSNRDIARAAQVAAGIADGSTTAADLPYGGREPHEHVEKLQDPVEVALACMPATRKRAGSDGKRSKLKADKKLKGRVANPQASHVVAANIWYYLGTHDVEAECSRKEPEPQLQLAAEELQSLFGESVKQQRMRKDLQETREALFKL